MKNNLILTGMPGAGKSTIGVVLAKTIGYDFLDTDILISKRFSSTLQSLMDSVGYDGFLQKESEVLCSLQNENTVIATGGSAVLSENAMNYLKGIGTVIYLDVPFDEIQKRLVDIKTRGIAFGPNKSLLDMYNSRLPLYKKYADTVIDESLCNNSEEVIEQIIEKLKISF